MHPATAIIALNVYKITKSDDALDQIVDALSEGVEHLTHPN
jgi:hypothetical protein